MFSEAVFHSLLARYSSGDGTVDRERLREIVSTLYVTRRELIFRYAASISRNPADAEEVTQEAFLCLYRHCASGQAVENVLQWLKIVAHHLMADRLRHSRFEAPHPDAVWNSISNNLADLAPNAEEVAVSEARQEQVRRLLPCLAEVERQCLQLRADGLQFREISRLLNVSMANSQFMRLWVPGTGLDKCRCHR